MNERLKRLLEAQARTWEQMKDIRNRADENGLIRGEDEESWTRANADIEKIGTADRRGGAGAQARHRRPVPRRRAPHEQEEEREEATADERYAEAFRPSSARPGDLTAEQRTVLRGGFVPDKRGPRPRCRHPTAGGYLAPTTWRDRIIAAADLIANVAAVADLVQTDSGETMAWVTEDDTANAGAILAENTQVTEQDMAWGTAQLGAYMYTSKLVRVSIQLLQDNAYNAEGASPRPRSPHGSCAERALHHRHRLLAAGGHRHQRRRRQDGRHGSDHVGHLRRPDRPGAVGARRLPPERRLHVQRRHAGRLRKVKDTTGQYLWQPGLQAGAPNQLNGHPYIINNYMPTPAANAKSILFGDFREGFVVRRVRDVQLLRLAERYADFLQVGFLAFNRADSKQQNAQAYKAYQQLRHLIPPDPRGDTRDG
jgi:hypothetical protein